MSLQEVIQSLKRERSDWQEASEFPRPCPHGHGEYGGMTCPECALLVLEKIGQLRTRKAATFCDTCGVETHQTFNSECFSCSPWASQSKPVEEK